VAAQPRQQAPGISATASIFGARVLASKNHGARFQLPLLLELVSGQKARINDA
jgi:hypothetical protein